MAKRRDHKKKDEPQAEPEGFTCAYCNAPLPNFDYHGEVADSDKEVFAVNLKIARAARFPASMEEAKAVIMGIVDKKEGLLCKACGIDCRDLFKPADRQDGIVSLARIKEMREGSIVKKEDGFNDFFGRRKTQVDVASLPEDQDHCTNCYEAIPDYDFSVDEGTGAFNTPPCDDDKKVWVYKHRWAETFSHPERVEAAYGERFRKVCGVSEGGLCEPCGRALARATSYSFVSSVHWIKEKHQKEHGRTQGALARMRARKAQHTGG